MVKKKKEEFRSVDKISKELDVVDNFVLRNWKKYTYIAIGVIIVIAVILFYYESKAKSSVQESQEILTAKTVAELQGVIKKYPDSRSIDYSRLDLGAKYFEQKDYDKALNAYKDEITNGNDIAAINIAKLNENYVLDAKGDNTNSAKGFAALADDTKLPEYIRAEAAYSAGCILLKESKKTEAMKYLNLCMTFKDSKGWSKFAKGLIDSNS